MAGQASWFVLLVTLPAVLAQLDKYTVPEATVEFLSPKGLKLSVPDVSPGAKLVAFHVNINDEFYALEHGQWAQDLIKKRDGRWTYIIKDATVKQGDTVYYWIYMVIGDLAYHGLDRSYQVTQANPHGGGSPQRPTPRPPTPTPRPTPTPTPSPPDRDGCQQGSLSTHNGGRQDMCPGDVMLEKHFNNLAGWSHVVQIGGNQLEDEFMVFAKESNISQTEAGSLVIRPALLEDRFSEDFVNVGELILDGCTSEIPEQCKYQGRFSYILPPVLSARLSTRDSFSFRYGIIEIKAKLPLGDWIVPELWLEPVQNVYSKPARVVLGLVRGNTDRSTHNNNWVLEAGVLDHLGRKENNVRWSQDYHTFRLVWTPEKLEFSVDDHQISRLPSTPVLEPSLNAGKVAPYDQEFYITLGVHVAGGQDFPDDMPNKPWKDTDPKRFLHFWTNKDKWQPTWDQNSALRVLSVKVTAL